MLDYSSEGMDQQSTHIPAQHSKCPICLSSKSSWPQWELNGSCPLSCFVSTQG